MMMAPGREEMKEWWGRHARTGAAVLVLWVVAAVMAGTHAFWSHEVNHASAAEMSPPSTPGPEAGEAEPGEDVAEPERNVDEAFRKAPSVRTGHSSLRIAPWGETGGGLWGARVSHRLELSPDDPMATSLRRGEHDLDDWIPFTTEVRTDADDDCPIFPDYLDDSTWQRLEQDGPKDRLHVYADSRSQWETTGGGDCVGDGDLPSFSVGIAFTIRDHLIGADGLHDRWRLKIEAQQYWVVAIRGATPLRQSATGAELMLPSSGKVEILFDAPSKASEVAEPTGLSRLSDDLQDVPAKGTACWIAAGMGAFTVSCVLPFVRRRASGASRLAWTTAAAVGAAATGATLLYAIASGWTDGALVPRGEQFQYSYWAVLLSAWCLVLLPLCTSAFAIRAVTGRPPRLRQLAPGAGLVTVLFLVPVAALALAGRPLALLLPAAAAVLATAAGITLRRELLGPKGRPWAPTAGVTVWLTLLAVGPGTGVSGYIDFDDVPEVNMAAVVGMLCVWPAALLLVLTSVARRPSKWPLTVASVWPMAVLVERPSLSWGESGRSLRAFSLVPHTAVAWALAGASFLAVGILLWLRQRSALCSGWPRQARPFMVLLGVTAATIGSLKSDSVDVTGLTTSGWIIVTIAALGFAWLFPERAEARARRLNEVRPSTHNRCMHALLREQTLAAGRREFLLASRTGLAEGEMSDRQWRARWQELGALGPRATAPHRSVALRLVALGTGGGNNAWRNGVAAAVLLGVLSLPWLVYYLPWRLDLEHSLTLDMDFILPGLGVAVPMALHWPLYGFVYGYVYSWLRGGTPLGKALCFMAVVLPCELAQLLHQEMEPGEFRFLVLFAVGHCLVVFLLLGLYWEARLVRAAGLRWGQIRDFRSLSALAVPATTVFVAVVTALVTAFMGVLVTPPPDPAGTQPTISTPTTGASR
jgi:hypothetical protein